MAYELVNSEVVYKGHVFDVHVDTITLPNDKTTQREVVKRGDAAAVVPIGQDGRVIFVRQYRHASRKMELEIPAGMVDAGEELITCAIRELEEETGYQSEQLIHLTTMYPAVGFCTERIAIYLATDLKPGKQNFDEDEFIELEYYTLVEAIDMIFSGAIADGKTVTGLLLAKEYFQEHFENLSESSK